MPCQELSEAVPFLISSDGGACYLRQVPAGPSASATSLGHGYAYRVGSECQGDTLLWETGWFSGPVVLSNNGHVLARLILGPAEQFNASDLPVLIFYRDGSEVMSYRFSEIVTAADVINTPTVGSPWCMGELHEWRNNGIEMIDLPLARGRIVSFDLNSGKRVEGGAAHEHGAPRTAIVAERELPEAEASRYVLAGGALVVGVILGLLIRRRRQRSGAA